MVQEWWGLDSGIKEMADRLAAEGFVALAPDLYHGDLAGHTEMDKAGQLLQSLPSGSCRARHERRRRLPRRPRGHDGGRLGVVGFCMGGMLRFVLAAQRPDRIKAIVPFYGFP